MAINWRAGLDEVEKSGQILGQGYTQLGQQARQHGEAMAALTMQNNQLKAQYDRQARQENQQMFETAVQGLEKYGQYKQKQEQMELEKQREARSVEEFNQRKTIFNQQQAEKKAAATAVVEGNKTELQGPTPTGEAMAPVEKIKIPKELKTAGAEEQAAYINTVKEAEAKKQAAERQAEMDELNKKNVTSEIENRQATQKMAKERLNLDRAKAAQDATEGYNKQLQESTKTVAERMKVASQPNGIYNTFNERDIKLNEEAKKNLKGTAASLETTRFVKQKLREIGELKEGQEVNQDTLKMISQKIENLPQGDKRAIELKALYTTLLMSGKEAGMAAGGFTQGEYSMMAGKSGAEAFEQVLQMDTDGTGMIGRTWNRFVAGTKREGAVAALWDKMNKDESTYLRKSGTEVSGAQGLYAVNKNDRDATLFELLPAEKKNAQGAFENFSKMSVDQQMTAIYGPEFAKSINVEQAKKTDVLAAHPELAAQEVAKQAIATLPDAGPLVPKADAARSLERTRTYLQAIASPTRRIDEPSSSGVMIPPEKAGQYAVTATPNGGFAPVVNSGGLPIFTGNPYGRSEMTPNPLGIKGKAANGNAFKAVGGQ